MPGGLDHARQRTYYVRMKNLTLRIDQKVLAEARKVAALRGTTVAKVVREYLRNYALAKGDEIYEERMRRFRNRASEAPGFAESPAPYEDRAMLEKVADRPPTLEEMTTDTGAPPEPGHDEWFRRQVQRALDDKKAGKAKYEDFRKVAAEFGFNAR